MFKRIQIIMIAVVGLSLFSLATPVLAATSGSGTSTASVTNIIDLEVTTVQVDLGDIRVSPISDIPILELVVNNNDSDGYTLTFHSNNGTAYTVGDNQGYLIHSSAQDGVTPNAGQKPSSAYDLSVIQDVATTSGLGGQYGTDDGDNRIDFYLDDSDHVVNYINATRATINGAFDVTMALGADPDLFHGAFTDTIQVTIADL